MCKAAFFYTAAQSMCRILLSYCAAELPEAARLSMCETAFLCNPAVSLALVAQNLLKGRNCQRRHASE